MSNFITVVTCVFAMILNNPYPCLSALVLIMAFLLTIITLNILGIVRAFCLSMAYFPASITSLRPLDLLLYWLGAFKLNMAKLSTVEAFSTL